MIFIILALFTSWPYFEKFKDYHLFKRFWIGASIICLLMFGIIDIYTSDSQAKNDKKELSKSMDTISSLSIKVNKLTEKLDKIKDGNDSRFDDLNDRFDALNDKVTLSIQENKGNIAESLNDTSK